MQNEPVMTIDENGNKRWYSNNELHRTDGPAVEYANGYKAWYLNGYRHRTDGPAVEYADGDKVWYLNGELHREDGPAIEWENGDEEWYLNGLRYTFDKWLELTLISDQEKIKLRFKYAI